MLLRPTCKTCAYFSLPGDNHETGWCMRYPPRLVVQPDVPDRLSEVWPVVEPTNWCGEHPDFPAYLASRAPAPA
jgi:hypothetical protein